MPKYKGCPNHECELNKKRVFVNKKEKFCSQCGTPLVYVCKNKKCFTFLEENDGDFCLKCQAKREDRQDAIVDGAKKIGGAMLAFGGIAVAVGEDALKIAGKIIKK